MDFHNKFLQKVCRATRALPVTYLKCPVPDEAELKEQLINPKQVSTSDCIIPLNTYDRYSTFIHNTTAINFRSALLGLSLETLKPSLCQV